jgi:hypothetical protein
MNDADVLNGDNGNVEPDAAFLAMLHRFYTVAMVQDWIDRAREGMRTRDRQVARWERTLEWLKQ